MLKPLNNLSRDLFSMRADKGLATLFPNAPDCSAGSQDNLDGTRVWVQMRTTPTLTKLHAMAVPIQLPTTGQNETFGGVTYNIEGELVPALHLELTSTGVYFEHHILLWKDPAVQIELHPMKGAFKRMLSGDDVSAHGCQGAGPHRLQPRRRGTRIRLHKHDFFLSEWRG
jgi:hypothetical protein